MKQPNSCRPNSEILYVKPPANEDHHRPQDADDHSGRGDHHPSPSHGCCCTPGGHQTTKDVDQEVQRRCGHREEVEKDGFSAKGLVYSVSVKVCVDDAGGGRRKPPKEE
jgi:hypothetical protein